MTTLNLFQQLASDPALWVTRKELTRLFPDLSESTTKHLFWKREQHPGLSSCCCIVGKTMMVNYRLFGLWMASQLAHLETGDLGSPDTSALSPCDSKALDESSTSRVQNYVQGGCK